jgi:Tetratricopeptide repeat
LFRQLIQTRKRVQGPDHPDTISCMVNLASMYRDQGQIEKADKLKVMTDILQLKGNDAQIMKEVIKIARSFDKDVMKVLLDRKRDDVQITEGVVTAAAGNRVGRAAEMMRLLLDRKGDEVHITEGAVVQIANLFNQEMIRCQWRCTGSVIGFIWGVN